MNLMPIMLIIWGVFTACFLALLAYNATLTRYEDDQLFLSDNANQYLEDKQSTIITKVNKTQPLIKAFGGAAGFLAVVIVAMYTWDAWVRLH